MSLLFLCHVGFSQSKLSFNNLAYEKGVTVFYLGSGGSSRYLDYNKFSDQTKSYKRTPFFSFGFDKCIAAIDGGNSYIGLGPYLSSWAANRYYTDRVGNQKESIWSNSLIALKLTHHNTLVIWKKVDMCVSIIGGARIKYYHLKKINNINITENSNRLSIEPAIGLTATVRYYFYNNLGVYFEAGAGYKTDLAAFGLLYKIKR